MGVVVPTTERVGRSSLSRGLSGVDWLWNTVQAQEPGRRRRNKRLRPYARVRLGVLWNVDEVSDGRIGQGRALVGSGCLDLKDLELHVVFGAL